MAESVFEAVKQSVTVREAAQMYGIEVNRSGMACCPFHDDKNPSMKLNEEYFYCFGCGATGDVIDFTARLYNLSPKEAAEKLAQDFGLVYDSQAPPRRHYVRQKTEVQKFKEDRDHVFRVLADYFHLLQKWETNYTPKTPEETPHPRFMEAIQKKDYTGYLLDFFLEDNPDEQKLWIAEHQSEIANLERRVKIMADKPTNRERLQEITAGIEQGIKELFESEKYMRYLSVMSKFHRYSVNNTMLIYMQRPDATLVAGFNKWKNQFERHVKKGEHGITIIAPTPYKKKIEEMKRDPDTHAPILDADGKAVMEEKEIEIPLFRPVKVFDVKQTEGKPLPDLVANLSGTVPHYEAFLEALRRSAPVPIEFEPMAESMDGYFSSEQQRIAIREGMSEVQTVSAAVHEVAHSKLHDPKKYEIEQSWKIVMDSGGGTVRDYYSGFATEAEAEQFAADMGWCYLDENQFAWNLYVEEDFYDLQRVAKNRNTEEVQAESVSYAVCQYFGIQTGENSFAYIASWSKDKDLTELRDSLETINKTSCELINDIERHYKEICKERGLDLAAAQKPEQAPQQAAEEKVPAKEVSQPSAEYQEATCQNTAEAATTQLPDAQEQALDKYPMPDPALTQNDLEKCGCLDSDLLPLSKERAYELMERDLTVYIIQEGENPVMAFDTADLDAHDGIFAVSREEWEKNPEFDKLVKDRMDHQEEREQAFLSYKGDCFAIYQVKDTDELRDIRYESLDRLQSIGQTVQRDNYELAYTAPLLPLYLRGDTTDQIYDRFQNKPPADYLHPPMCVSDIVALKRDGTVSCHYCDRFGFEQVPGFLPDNPLKNAEMTLEDDYGMIDGIINNGPKEPTVAQLEQQARSGQPISLMDLAAAAHREDREKKKSVMEQLKSQTKAEHKKAAPKKSAEREI